VDADGFILIIDQLKDVIKSGSEIDKKALRESFESR
jgi:hypothetical protein